MYEVQVLQCDGNWVGGFAEDQFATFAQANEEAVRINTEYFTATRVVDDMEHVMLYVLPQFDDVAYPGRSCAAARAVLAKFK